MGRGLTAPIRYTTSNASSLPIAQRLILQTNCCPPAVRGPSLEPGILPAPDKPVCSMSPTGPRPSRCEAATASRRRLCRAPIWARNGPRLEPAISTMTERPTSYGQTAPVRLRFGRWTALRWRNSGSPPVTWAGNGASPALPMPTPTATPIIIWQSNSGDAAVWSMSGTTLAGFGIPAGHMGSEWRLAEVGDFNGDHKADALWVSGDVSAWL